jgi:hypothetical protein
MTTQITEDQIEGRCLSHLTDHQLYVGVVRQIAEYVFENQGPIDQNSKAFAFLMQFRDTCFAPNCREVAEGMLIAEYFRTQILLD